MVIEDMVVEKILDKAAVTEKGSTYDEVLAPEPPPETEGGDE